MAKLKLKIEVKRFIVKSLAVYESPSDVVESVKIQFEIELTRQAVQMYDPTKVAGEGLSDELKRLFFDTRQEFEETEILPLSKKIVRIKKLSKYVESFENMGNYVAAAEGLAQIAKEEGGMFTNRKEISGPGGKPMEIHSKTLADWNKDAETRTNQATAVLEIFDEAG